MRISVNAYSAVVPIGGKGITREFIVIHLMKPLIPGYVLLEAMALAPEEISGPYGKSDSPA